MSRLKELFPNLRDRSDLLMEIRQNPVLSATFNSWLAEQQEEFLDFCTGVSGIKMLYDSFFKEPDTVPARTLGGIYGIGIRPDDAR